MSFEVSELMMQLTEAKEKEKPACKVSTKAPECQPGSTTKAPPTECQPGSTTRVPERQPMICQPGSTTRAEQTSVIEGSADFDAVREQLRSRLTTV
jgi:hypothetical protein